MYTKYFSIQRKKDIFIDITINNRYNLCYTELFLRLRGKLFDDRLMKGRQCAVKMNS